ncbi:MAG: class I SAM-dependent methyltransferase [Anaerohalosphaeraceae bacterium]
MTTPNVVRGYGPLDKLIARLRHGIAYRKLKPYYPLQCCLDIGSGAYPAFLIDLQARQKFGLEKSVSEELTRHAASMGITLVEHDLSRSVKLPFEDRFFDTVTMLAVIEHIEPPAVAMLLSEVYRILRPGGRLMMTTPAAWTDALLRGLAFCRLISREEIDDHKDTFTQTKVKTCIAGAGFDTITTGSFECGMNLWAFAVKKRD